MDARAHGEPLPSPEVRVLYCTIPNVRVRPHVPPPKLRPRRVDGWSFARTAAIDGRAPKHAATLRDRAECAGPADRPTPWHEPVLFWLSTLPGFRFAGACRHIERGESDRRTRRSGHRVHSDRLSRRRSPLRIPRRPCRTPPRFDAERRGLFGVHRSVRVLARRHGACHVPFSARAGHGRRMGGGSGAGSGNLARRASRQGSRAYAERIRRRVCRGGADR